MWTVVGVATGLTVALTFVLPVVHRPHLAAHDEA